MEFAKILLVLIPSIFVNICEAQFSSRIGIVGGLESSNYIYSDRNVPNVQELVNKKKLDELSKLNYRWGFDYILNFKNTIYLKSGLRFMKGGYKTRQFNDIKWPQEFDDQGNWTPRPDLHHEYQGTFDFVFIEMPLIIGYQFRNGNKIKPLVETGFSPSYWLNTTSLIDTDLYTRTSVIKPDNTVNNVIQITYSLGIGMNIQLSNKINCFLISVGRYNLTPLADKYEIQGILVPGVHLYNFGFETGIQFSLNKKNNIVEPAVK